MSHVRFFTFALLTTLASAPAVVSAQPKTYVELVKLVLDLINIIIPVIFGGLFLFFMWKVIDAWILHGGDEARREEGKKYITAAIIAFVVMSSAWGIVTLIENSLFG